MVVARQVVEMTTKGRGHSIAVEMSTLDWRHGDVSLCHPLRDVEMKEATLFARFSGLQTYGFVPCQLPTSAPCAVLLLPLLLMLAEYGFPAFTRCPPARQASAGW